MTARPPAAEPHDAPAAAPDRLVVPIADRLLWGLDDLTAMTGASRRTFERERSAGRLPPPDKKIGKRPFWTPATIRRWIAEGGGR